MADRIYGIQQSQPQDVASYFKQVRASRDASQQLVQNIFLVSKIGPSARATDGYDLIFGDRIAYYDTPLSDGRTIRYGKIDLFIVGHGTVGAFDTNAALDTLALSGYDHVDQISTGNTKASLLALTGEVDSGQYDDLDNYIYMTLKAGGPRYIGEERSIEDAPNDGQEYVRRGGKWKLNDLTAYDTITSVNAKIAASVGSQFRSRNIVTTAETTVFADGEAALPDPAGTSGWYYENSAGAKANWYFYAGGEDTDTLGAFQAADGGYYMVIDAKNTTSWPYLTVYTERQNDGSDASWYRSRINYGPGGDYANKLASGLHILHTPNLDAAVITQLQGDYPTAAVTELQVDTSSTVGPQGTTEDIWLMAISTSSGAGQGTEKFVLRENAVFFGGNPRSWQYVANPAQQPEYTNYFRGSYAVAADFPESGALDQWLIETTEDVIYVWDTEGGEWVKTGTVAEAPTAAVNDYPYQYVYSSFDGSGYGFENASPQGNWSNTPDGKLQATGYSSDILSRRVKFATLKSPGDEVTFQVSNNTSAFYRYGFFGLTPGTDPETISWKVAGQPSSGVAWMTSNTDDYALIEFQVSYMEPYFGGSTYGYNMTGRRNSTGIGYDGNAGELPVTFRVADDYRIEMFIDGHYNVKTQVVPSAGVDLYFHSYGETGRILEQPTGSGSNIQGGTAPSASGAHYYMTDVAPSRVEATIIGQGGGYWLYSDTEASGAGYNVELSDNEASAARWVLPFQDFTGATLQERIDTMRPVIAEDTRVLGSVEETARGYFHSLDLDVATIQGKMGLYADALAAATAGAVEVTQSALVKLLTATPASTSQTIIHDGGTYGGDETGALNGSTVFGTTFGMTRFSLNDPIMTLFFDGTTATQIFATTITGITIAGGGTQDGSYALTPQAVGKNFITYDLSAAGVANVGNLVNQFNSGSHPLDVSFTSTGTLSAAVAVGEDQLVTEMKNALDEHLQKFPR